MLLDESFVSINPELKLQRLRDLIVVQVVVSELSGLSLTIQVISILVKYFINSPSSLLTKSPHSP